METTYRQAAGAERFDATAAGRHEQGSPRDKTISGVEDSIQKTKGVLAKPQESDPSPREMPNGRQLMRFSRETIEGLAVRVVKGDAYAKCNGYS